MSYVVWISVAMLLLFAATAWLAVWSRRDTWGRPAAVAMFLIGIPAVAGAGIESLGWHKPLKLAWDLGSGDHRVLAAKMVQDRGIYLYVDDPERIEPRPILLPWDNEAADRIQKLMNEATSESQGQFMMRYEPSLDVRAPQFHPLPQPPALPPKPRPELGLEFEQGA